MERFYFFDTIPSFPFFNFPQSDERDAHKVGKRRFSFCYTKGAV